MLAESLLNMLTKSLVTILTKSLVNMLAKSLNLWALFYYFGIRKCQNKELFE